jgi:hypothetical protein
VRTASVVDEDCSPRDWIGTLWFFVRFFKGITHQLKESDDRPSLRSATNETKGRPEPEFDQKRSPRDDVLELAITSIGRTRRTDIRPG